MKPAPCSVMGNRRVGCANFVRLDPPFFYHTIELDVLLFRWLIHLFEDGVQQFQQHVLDLLPILRHEREHLYLAR